MRPVTYPEAMDRGLLAENGIRTFSNGTQWEMWADGNCLECRYYELDGAAGELCAFEGAALLREVSPDLARLFGWVENATHPGCFNAPDTCRFFLSRTDDDGNERPLPTPTDPHQLVLIADPTEDAAMIQQAPVRQEVAA